MIAYILLAWIGLALNAPWYYWWAWGIGALIKLISFGFSMYKAGRE